MSSRFPTIPTIRELQNLLYKNCARRLHLVSRAYLMQGVYAIRACRALIESTSASQRDRGIRLRELKQAVEVLSAAIGASYHVFIGHQKNTAAEQGFKDVTHKLSTIVPMFSPTQVRSSWVLSSFSDKVEMIRIQKEDLECSQKIGALQKEFIRNSAQERRKYLRNFCELATGSEPQSAYHSNAGLHSHIDHIQYSKPILLDQTGTSNAGVTSPSITMVQLLFMADFSTNVDVFITLSALMAALHMRAQPFLGVVYLHRLQPRMDNATKFNLTQLGKNFIGSQAEFPRSRFAFVSVNWVKNRGQKPNPKAVASHEKKEAEFATDVFPPIFPADFKNLKGGKTPPLLEISSDSFAYFRLGETDIAGESSAKTIILSFLTNHLKRQLTLLHSQLLGEKLGNGLCDTTLGTSLGKAMRKVSLEEAVDEEEEVDLREFETLARAETSILQLMSSNFSGQFILSAVMLDGVKQLTQNSRFIVIFGYSEAFREQLLSKGQMVPHYLPLARDSNGTYLLLLQTFTNSEADELLLSELARTLLFMKKYGFSLAGIVSILPWPSVITRVDACMRHNLDMVFAICGPESFGSLVFLKSRPGSTWSASELKSRFFEPFKSAGARFLDNPAAVKSLGLLTEITSLFDTHTRGQPQQNLALVDELERGSPISTTSAGQIVQEILTTRLAAVQEEIQQSFYQGRNSPDSHELDIQGLYLQTGIIRFSESYNIYQGLYAELESNVGLEKAIRQLEALLLCQSDMYSGKQDASAFLGGLYQEHFDKYGEEPDLKESAKNYEKAAKLVGNTDPKKKAQYLDTLTQNLETKFQIFGKKDDLVAAIDKCREVVNNHMDAAGYTDIQKSVTLHALGALLKRKFEVYFDDVQDIDEAIGHFQLAKTFLPPRHRAVPILIAEISSSLTLRSKFEKEVVGNTARAIADVEGAILEYSTMRPEPSRDHLAYPVLQNVKCKAFGKHYRLTKECGDRRGGKIQPNIEEAIIAGEEAVKYSHHTTQECGYLLNLGKAYGYRHQYANEGEKDASIQDLEEALLCMKSAAECEAAQQMIRFKAARNWGKWARQSQQRNPSLEQQQEVLKAYQYCITLLSQLTGQDIPIDEQYRRLEKMQSVVYSAVETAISYSSMRGNNDNSIALRKVVEWFEEGRGVVWNHYFKRDEVLEELRRMGGEGRELVIEFESNWTERRVEAVREGSMGSHMTAAVGDGKKEEETTKKGRVEWYRGLVEKGKEIWNKIQGLVSMGSGEGDSRDQGGKWERLSTAARFGPVILLNITENRCDAVIIQEGRDDQQKLRHINLGLDDEGVTLERAKKWEADLRAILTASGLVNTRGVVRETGTSDSTDKKVRDILTGIWNGLAKPIVHVLKSELGFAQDTRIFWCASGPLAFLPLHAAGNYSTKQKGSELQTVQGWFVSSYVPSLYPLLRISNAMENTRPPKVDDRGMIQRMFDWAVGGKKEEVDLPLKILAVAQSETKGYSRLPETVAEVKTIQGLGQGKDAVRVYMNDEATVENIVSEVTECEWVHFACHGKQDPVDGLKSALILFEGKELALRRLVELRSRPKSSDDGTKEARKPEFAYLSACESAVGDSALPEEHVHLAAGMLVAGYLGVVATMWSIGDKEGAGVARGVYTRLFEEARVNGLTKPDYRSVAKALRDSVEELRSEKKSAFLQWIPFIHVGL